VSGQLLRRWSYAVDLTDPHRQRVTDPQALAWLAALHTTLATGGHHGR
jgi:hypothetical protein